MEGRIFRARCRKLSGQTAASSMPAPLCSSRPLQVVQEEKAAFLPPRLGKQKFEPSSVQVALTDDLSGSLRCVRPYPMVALDRFKSLQQRGLIEPRRPVAARAGRRVTYEKGGRTEKAMEGQTEIDDMRKRRKQVAKAMQKK